LNLNAMATLAFRLAGLFGLTWTLGSLPAALLLTLSHSADAPWMLVYWLGVINVLSLGLVALFLLLRARRLADRVADREARAGSSDGTTVQAVGLTLVGCWFFLQGSAEVLRLLIPNLRTQAGLLVVARGDWSQFTAAVIQLAAGLVVTVRAGRLSAWCTRVQKTAAKEPAP